MKIYLAAASSHFERMVTERETYRRAGFEVTSRWLDGLADHERWDETVNIDLADIDAADALVVYSFHGSSHTGGRHVEFGYAMGKQKIVILVGPPENVFYYHSHVIHCKDTDHVIQLLQILSNRENMTGGSGAATAVNKNGGHNGPPK